MPDSPKRAFITEITGQDISYLAELLLGKGYHVHGLARRSSSFSTQRIDRLYPDRHEPNGSGCSPTPATLSRWQHEVQRSYVFLTFPRSSLTSLPTSPSKIAS